MLFRSTYLNSEMYSDSHPDATLRVLIVDDEPDLRHLLGMSLEALGGYEVHTACDAKSALLSVKQQERPFDGVFLDIQMPGISGIRLCAILRATPGYADVPILMLTAMTDREHLQKAFIAGASDLIPKPFDFDDLEARFAGERSNRFRRDSLKAVSGLGGDGHAAPTREVIRSLDDAVAISDVERCIKKEAFEVYLRQSVVRFSSPIWVRAIKIGRVYDLFTRLPEPEFQRIIRDIAHAYSITTDESEDIFTYAGNGIFLSTSLGKSLCRNQAFIESLRKQDSVRALRAQALRLHIFWGNQTAIAGRSDSEVIAQINDTIDSAEKVESNQLGWGSYGEWLSQKHSIGNEQRNNEQTNYQWILNDFIRQGQLGWRK